MSDLTPTSSETPADTVVSTSASSPGSSEKVAHRLRTAAGAVTFRLLHRASGRLQFAFGWVNTHRRESAATVIACMVLCVYIQQDVTMSNVASVSDDSEFSDVEQLVSDFASGDVDVTDHTAPSDSPFAGFPTPFSEMAGSSSPGSHRNASGLAAPPDTSLAADHRQNTVVMGISNTRPFQASTGTASPAVAASANHVPSHSALQIPADDSATGRSKTTDMEPSANIRFRGNIQPLSRSAP